MPWFRVISDIHLEFQRRKWKKNDKLVAVANNQPRADVLILAGDIGYPKLNELQEFLSLCEKNYTDLIYVAGNHESYNMDINAAYICLLQRPYFMQQTERVVCGVRVLGCTLWTSPTSKSGKYGDYTNIVDRGSPTGYFTVDCMRARHAADLEWLRLRLAEGPALVVTHHAPILDSSPPDCTTLEDHFATNVGKELGEKTLAWVYGHTHWAKDETVYGTRFISNPLGYDGEETGYKDVVFEIKTASL